ncbi:S8 family serine peptidase [uncultured Alistipes sp.]|jgi:subtilisin-like serine proteases|uniref:S8 family serine peptidase n=1 Tax=uncultured Alistipes sp. TaxID=538949 RepID=UPI0025FCD87C|nr:S8 family serine peptidase [uncultured Alistipes sp.]
MKRKSSLILATAIVLLVVYGAYDIVREVRGAYTSQYRYTYSHAISQMMGPRFDTLTLRGKGIKIGVVDAGFGKFRSDRFTRGLHVADYRDLTTGDTTGFFADKCTHGTEVVKNIGGYSNDTLLGLAGKAAYYLVKADLETQEPRDDERRLCLALEWLAEQGVDVINVSLNYTVFDDFNGYTPEMLDGHTALCSRFADSLLQANPRLILVVAAGNGGDKKWKYIGFPADAEQAITVGATNFDGSRRAAKSGRGYYPQPVKPDVVVYDSPSGTSFSAPVIAGLCATVVGYEPMDRQEMIRLLHAAGTKSNAPDSGMGYGVPRCDSLLGFIDEKKDRL